jgi:HAD superfamily hydrolase (TIGR01509 family)
MNTVLFDLDGTLANTEILKAKALAWATKELGGDSSPEIYKDVMGKSWSVVTDHFFSHGKIKTTLEVFDPLFRKFYSRLVEDELFDKRSAADFLKFLKSKSISVGLVSSASPWMIQKVLQKLDLGHAFKVIISGADTELHKPHPSAYLLALDKLSVSSAEVITFEDSDAGFHAAISASLPVFGVKHEFNERHDFSLCQKTLGSFDECLDWKIFN